tara:strand:+ start:182 stop:511 length:330 start_codon:yes stop_codon:yes gene_type:complete
MKYNDLKPRQQEFVQSFYQGLVLEAENSNEDLSVPLTYTRQYLRYMSSKYCDMEWAPAWIVKDKSRAIGGGEYSLPEVVNYANDIRTKRDELPADDGETIIIGTEVVSA